MKVNVNGQMLDAVQVPFSAVNESWAEYHLDDGRVLRVKVVVTKVFRTEKTNDDGIPMYSIASQQVIVVDEKQE